MKHTMKALKAAAAGSRNNGRGMSVQRMELIGETAANVLLHFAAAAPGRTANVTEAIASAFGGKVRALPNAAYYPNAKDPSLVLAMVALNQETRAAGSDMEDAYDGLTACTASTFTDEDDNIWRRVGEGEEAFLVKESDDDLAAILAARQASSIVTASARVTLHERANGGDAIGWYDTGKEVMRYGACLATVNEADDTTVIAMDVDSGAVCEIAAEQVHIVVSDVPPALRQELASGASSILGRQGLTRQNYLAAWLKMAEQIYGGKHSAYFKMMKDLMAKTYGRQAIMAA